MAAEADVAPGRTRGGRPRSIAPRRRPLEKARAAALRTATELDAARKAYQDAQAADRAGGAARTPARRCALPGLRAAGHGGAGGAGRPRRCRRRSRPGTRPRPPTRRHRARWPSGRRRPGRWNAPSTGPAPSTSSWSPGWPRSTRSSPTSPGVTGAAPRARTPWPGCRSRWTRRSRRCESARERRAPAAAARGGGRAAAAGRLAGVRRGPRRGRPVRAAGRRRATTSRRPGRRWPAGRRPKWTRGDRRAPRWRRARPTPTPPWRRCARGLDAAVPRRRAARARRPRPGGHGGGRAGHRGAPAGRGAARPGAGPARQAGRARARRPGGQGARRPPAGQQLRALAARGGARPAGRGRVADPARAVQRAVRPRPRQGRVLRRRPPRRRAAPRRAHAVRRRDVPGVAGARAGPGRAARRHVDRGGQPGVDPARRGLRHARRGDAGHGGGDAGGPGRPRRPDGRRGHPRAARWPSGSRCGSRCSKDARTAPTSPGAGYDGILRRRLGPGVRGLLRRRRRAPGAQSTAQIDTDVELPAAAWATARPRRRRSRAPDVVLLVDGVRRIDATLWTRRGRTARRTRAWPRRTPPVWSAATCARAWPTLAGTLVERGLFTASPDARPTSWPARSATAYARSPAPATRASCRCRPCRAR